MKYDNTYEYVYVFNKYSQRAHILPPCYIHHKNMMHYVSCN